MKTILITPQTQAEGCPLEGMYLFADSALMADRRQPLFLPSWSAGWQIEIVPAVRISRQGRNIAPKFATRYYDAITLMAVLLPAGARTPTTATLLADESLRTGVWMPLEGSNDGSDFEIRADYTPLGLHADPAVTLQASASTALVAQYIARISAVATLKTGDIVAFTPLSGRLLIHDITENHLISAYLNNQDNLNIKIK